MQRTIVKWPGGSSERDLPQQQEENEVLKQEEPNRLKLARQYELERVY